MLLKLEGGLLFLSMQIDLFNLSPRGKVTHFGVGVGPADSDGQLWMESFLKGIGAYEKAHPELKFHLLDGVSFHHYSFSDASRASAVLLSSTDEGSYLLTPLGDMFCHARLTQDQGSTSSAPAATITPLLVTPKASSGSPGKGPLVISSPTPVPGGKAGSQQIVLGDHTLIINSVSKQMCSSKQGLAGQSHLIFNRLTERIYALGNCKLHNSNGASSLSSQT